METINPQAWKDAGHEDVIVALAQAIQALQLQSAGQVVRQRPINPETYREAGYEDEIIALAQLVQALQLKAAGHFVGEIPDINPQEYKAAGYEDEIVASAQAVEELRAKADIRTGVPTLMPDAVQSGASAPGVQIAVVREIPAINPETYREAGYEDEIIALAQAIQALQLQSAGQVVRQRPSIKPETYHEAGYAEEIVALAQAIVTLQSAITGHLAGKMIAINPQTYIDVGYEDEIVALAEGVKTFQSKLTEIAPACARDKSQEEPSPAEAWEAHATKRFLDELFTFAGCYRSTESYKLLLDFVSRFRFYSPYNGMLVRVQMEGARFVAPAHRWLRHFGRTIKANAQPLMILQPMGPVMFVFDVSDTEAGPDAKPLPKEVEEPFEIRRGKISDEWSKTVANAKRDGIRILPARAGSQSAGSIKHASANVPASRFQTGTDKEGNPKYVEVPTRYDVVFNDKLSLEARYATLVHELAHLYCGHIGTPNKKWWPNRQGLTVQVAEFEAESVAYLVCARLGIDNPSAAYLAGYLSTNTDVPKISIDLVMKAAGLIEKMGKEQMKQRRTDE